MSGNDDKLLAELIAIKKLLMLQLIVNGVNATDIGNTLGLTKARIGQIVPVAQIKKARKK